MPQGHSSHPQPQNNQGARVQGCQEGMAAMGTRKASLKERPCQDFWVPAAIPCGRRPLVSAWSPAEPASWLGWAWYSCLSHNTPHAGAESLHRPGDKTQESESAQEPRQDSQRWEATQPTQLPGCGLDPVKTDRQEGQPLSQYTLRKAPQVGRATCRLPHKETKASGLDKEIGSQWG